MRLLDPLVANRVGDPGFREVDVVVAGQEEVEVPAGTFPCLRVEVRPVGEEEARLTVWLEEAPRRALVRLKAADGRRMALADLQRRAYWKDGG